VIKPARFRKAKLDAWFYKRFLAEWYSGEKCLGWCALSCLPAGRFASFFGRAKNEEKDFINGKKKIKEK